MLFLFLAFLESFFVVPLLFIYSAFRVGRCHPHVWIPWAQAMDLESDLESSVIGNDSSLMDVVRISSPLCKVASFRESRDFYHLYNVCAHLFHIFKNNTRISVEAAFSFLPCWHLFLHVCWALPGIQPFPGCCHLAGSPPVLTAFSPSPFSTPILTHLQTTWMISLVDP